MSVRTMSLRVSTRGHCRVVDLTPEVQAKVDESGFHDGTLTVFVIGSTAGLTSRTRDIVLPLMGE